ncbi:MAG: hypothetical protein ACRDRN_03535 [Sciscionella sp.]
MAQLEIAWPSEPGAGSHRAGTSLDGLRLHTRIGELNWLASAGDGPAVVVTRIVPPQSTRCDRIVQDAKHLVSLREPSLVPVLGAICREGDAWLISERDGGISLRRLLRLAAPTAAQAVWLGRGALSALRCLHGAGYSHGRLHTGDLRLGQDGRIRLAGWAPGALPVALPSAGGRHADVVALASVLGELARAARRSAVRRDARILALLGALDSSAERACAPGADVEAVAAALWEPEVPATAQGELAAVVVAATGAGPPAVPAPRSSEPERAPREEVREPRLRPALRAVAKPALMWLAALAALAVAILLEVTFLHDKLNHDVALLRSGADSATATTATAPARAVPPPAGLPAPAADGAVAGVDLRAMSACTAGSACPVRILVRLDPRSAPMAVRWRFQIVNRCTGASLNRGGGTATARPHADHVYAVSTPQLPRGRALAVMAVVSVTDPVSRAASPALRVPAGGGTC